MERSFCRRIAAGMVLCLAAAGCGSAIRTRTHASTGNQAIRTAAEMVRADNGTPPYGEADVRFMTGMIRHHAQAVLIAGWAPTHGASSAVRTLCERIVVAQQDEIAFMQSWLRQRDQPVPDADAAHDMMPGMEHVTLMPGMLTAEQLTELDRARGAAFDRLFLTYMIQHHEGAITMVEQLFGAYGAAQDDDIFKLAADVNVDQITEIDRMRTMLAALSPGERSP
jgi:uncharacterized protein (DUF305 family)